MSFSRGVMPFDILPALKDVDSYGAHETSRASLRWVPAADGVRR